MNSTDRMGRDDSFVTRDGKRLIFLILDMDETAVYQVDSSVIWRLRPDPRIQWRQPSRWMHR